MRKPDADPPPPRVCVALPQNGKCQIFHSHYVAVCRSKVLVVCVCEFWSFLFQKTKFILYRNIQKKRRNSIQLAKKTKEENERNSVSPGFCSSSDGAEIGQRYRQPSCGWQSNYELRRYRQRGKRALTTAAVSRRPVLVDSTGCGASICCWPPSSFGSSETQYANECHVSLIAFECLMIFRAVSVKTGSAWHHVQVKMSKYLNIQMSYLMTGDN